MKSKDFYKFYLIAFLKLFFLLTLVYYSSFFSLKFNPHLLSETITNFTLPKFFYPLVLHDGLHYLSIAKYGYYTYEQAYFPLWPIILSSLAHWHKFLALTTIVWSNLFFVVFIWQLYLFCQKLEENQVIQKGGKIFIFLLALPSSFILHTAYNESLFLLLLFTILNLLLAKSNHYFAIFFLGAFLTSTRVTGILIIPALLFLIKEIDWRKKLFTLFLGASIGFGAYLLYLQISVGDPLFFLHSQSYFGANRSSSLVFPPQVVYRYLKIFLTANWNLAYGVAIGEFIALLLSMLGVWKFIINIKSLTQSHLKEILYALGVFSILSLLLPMASGTLSSFPRYILSAPAVWIGLSFIKSKFASNILIILLISWQIIAFLHFGNGYFVF